MLLGAWPLGGKNTSQQQKGGKLRFLLLCGGYIIFLIIGAAVFSAIEAPKIEDLSKAIEILRNSFMEKNTCINDRRKRSEYEDLDSNNTQTQMPNTYNDCKYSSVDMNEFIERTQNLKNLRTCGSPERALEKFRRTIIKQNVCFSFYMLFYVIYLVLGGFCFHLIELPLEKELKDFTKDAKESFAEKYPEVSDDDLEEFLAQVIKANDRGISPLRNSSSELNWGFGQSLFFSSTVVTTIGYGHVTPLSQTGKIFCMIYATIGIPLTLVLLTAMVERLLIPANWLLGSLNSKLGHLYQPFNIRLLHLFIIVSIVGILIFAIPTIVFAFLEPEWGWLDAFYYCFISLTTIGLGDYIPGDGVSVENRSLYKICITFYLVCGLIAMMLALTVFYDIPQLNLGQLFTENSTGETEKLRLSGGSAPCYSGPSGLYIPQRDEDMRRAVVRIRPHGDESPSPDDQPPSLHRDMRVP